MTTCQVLLLLLLHAGVGQFVLCAAIPFIPVIPKWPAQLMALPALYFLLQGMAVEIERRVIPSSLKRLWAALCVVAPSGSSSRRSFAMRSSCAVCRSFPNSPSPLPLVSNQDHS
jgi:hypothetical protein